MKKAAEESESRGVQRGERAPRPHGSHAPTLRPATVLLLSLLHYVVLLIVAGLIYFASHLPPKAVNLDGLIMVLFQTESFLTAPRKFLIWLWPGESTPGFLSLFTTVLNSLVWGCLLAIGRVIWKKARE